MNRRRLLGMIGLAPLIIPAAAVSAATVPATVAIGGACGGGIGEIVEIVVWSDVDGLWRLGDPVTPEGGEVTISI